MEREASLVFHPDHPAFAGHFPGMPIVPGVLLLDAALHALEQASGAAAAIVVSAKFLRPVGPGEALGLAWGEGERARFDIKSQGRPVATGTVAMDKAGPEVPR